MIAMYSYERSLAASTISPIVPDPSLQRVCICKSPRNFFDHPGLIASCRLASASEMKFRRMSGIVLLNWGGLSIQRKSCFAMNGPMPRNSVNGRFCSTRLAAFSGHRNALRAARRKARERIPVSRSACWARSALKRRPRRGHSDCAHSIAGMRFNSDA